MLQLRLEIISSENISDICNQATRIATVNGIEVVFQLNGKDVVAKPGMSGESLACECTYEPAKEKDPAKVKEPKAPKQETGEKTGKGGKSKTTNPTDESTTGKETEVQKEGV